jgi:Ca2+-binding EF-hand superfamily protein
VPALSHPRAARSLRPPCSVDDTAAAAKAAETAEEKKRKLAACKAFSSTHALRLPRLRQVFAKCLATTYFNRQEGFISQHEMAEVRSCAGRRGGGDATTRATPVASSSSCRPHCPPPPLQLFDIKPTAPEVVGIFKSYVLTDGEAERVGTVNAREVLLALSAFVGATVEQRVRFVFELFDFDGSGTLEVDELIAIMRANHLAADPEAAGRKLQTILPAGMHADDDLALDFDEFLALANRFPNVIFPQFT